MRDGDVDYVLRNCGVRIPLVEDIMLSSTLAEGEISQGDLQLIDSFAGLHKAKRQIVLDMVRRGLHEKLPARPE
ncbi:hypothetical protein [Candidatus Tokpelaia sp.]|uniref:hypothetical protein n=1 Tax=Candidatus Tokpelaia sp. TaxID=2233777 RepID=UPI00123A514B|nr:hypothetical protein [Candidatus Tokpelaia sp.]